MTRAMTLTKPGLFLVLLFLFLSASSSFAQFSIKGKITDETGKPLSGASVLITGTYEGTSANSHGEFLLNHLKKGKYLLKTSFIGFESQKAEITIPSEKIIEFKLKPSRILTDEIIVSGIRAGAQTPVAFTNIDKERIEKVKDGQDIPFLLSTTPSVITSSESGIGMGNTTMYIRGSDPSRINVTINGIPLNDPESQAVFWVDIPDLISSVDNIQVQRGLGTSTNGSAAFGASVNLQTETLNKDPYTELQSIIGSFHTFKESVKTSTGLMNNHFVFDARYSQQKSNGYIDRASSNHKSIFLSGAYLSENSLTRLNIIHGEEHTGITWEGNPNPASNRKYNSAGEYIDANGNTQYYPNETDNYFQTHYQLIHSQKFSDQWTINGALHYTQGSGYYEEYKSNKDFSNYGLSYPIINGSTILKTNLVQQKWMSNDFYGGVFSSELKSDNLNLTLGGAWNRYDGDHFGRLIWMQYANTTPKDYEWYRNNGTKTDYNFYIKTEIKPSDILHVYTDMQYRHIDYRMTGPDDDLMSLTQYHHFNFFNPKAGIFADFNNQNQLYASAGIGHREPTRSDFENAKGDPSSTPKAETLYDFEAGYNFKSIDFTASANLYYMYYYNQLIPTGQKSNVGYDIMTNADKSYRTGIELVASCKIFSSLRWDANATFSRNKIHKFIEYSTYYSNWNETTQEYETSEYKAKAKGNTDIAYSPDLIASSVISYSPLPLIDFKLISKYVGKQYFDNTSSKDRELNDYFLNHLRADYNFRLKNLKKGSFFVQINNLFNIKYNSSAYGGNYYENNVEKTWADYFPQAGTYFLSGITFKF